MWGEPDWSPWSHLAEHHRDVRVRRTLLPGRLLGCVDLQRRIIWLDTDLTEVQERCTLAFELGQLEHGPVPANPCLAAAHRRASEDWAARMLIPTGRLLAGFSVSFDLSQIADVLEVDCPTLRARLRGLADDEQDMVMDVLRGMSAVA